MGRGCFIVFGVRVWFGWKAEALYLEFFIFRGEGVFFGSCLFLSVVRVSSFFFRRVCFRGEVWGR